MGDGRKKAEEHEQDLEDVREAIHANRGAKRVGMVRKKFQNIKETERFYLSEHEELSNLIEKCDEFIYSLIKDVVSSRVYTYEVTQVMDKITFTPNDK